MELRRNCNNTTRRPPALLRWSVQGCGGAVAGAGLTWRSCPGWRRGRPGRRRSTRSTAAPAPWSPRWRGLASSSRMTRSRSGMWRALFSLYFTKISFTNNTFETIRVGSEKPTNTSHLINITFTILLILHYEYSIPSLSTEYNLTRLQEMILVHWRD